MMGSAPARFAVNCSILFTDLPLLERPAAAREAGFDAVEFWWPFSQPMPSAAEQEAFVDAIEAAGLTLASLGFDHGDLAAGDRGLFASQARSDRLRRNMDAVVEIGVRTGCRTFVGLFGKPDDGDSPFEVAARHFTEAGRTVAQIGGEVVLEPISGTPEYAIQTLDQAVAFIDEVRLGTGVDNLGVLADLFHLCETETDVAAALHKHASSIRYVQLADRPGRGVPGSGDQPLAELLALVHTLGYSGPVGLEFVASEHGTAADLAAFRRWLYRQQIRREE
jgi:hydroxypyruvate isomerase